MPDLDDKIPMSIIIKVCLYVWMLLVLVTLMFDAVVVMVSVFGLLFGILRGIVRLREPS